MNIYSRRISGALSVISAVLLLGTLPVTRSFDQAPFTHAQRLIDVGGRLMNVYCTGRGSPTVILDTDGHEGTDAWRYVQPSIAKITRVCSYDAAGFGFSDASAGPRDASAFVNDLHTLLVRADIRAPYVLVGYQPSGLYDRLFTDRYLHDVAGLVLVDPVESHRRRRIDAVAPALVPLFAAASEFVRECYDDAAAGTMHPGTPAFSRCLITPGGPPLPRALALVNQRQWERVGTWRDYEAAGSSTLENVDSTEIDRAQRNYGAMPLIVLTSDTAALGLPLPSPQLSSLAKARQLWHEKIADLSAIGSEFVVAGSSDSIAVDDPFAVVAAIDEVVAQARNRFDRNQSPTRDP